MLTTLLAGIALGLAARAPAPTTVALDNGVVRRELAFDGHAWRTVAFARSNGEDRLPVRSDEFHVLLFDDTALTVDDFEAEGPPRRVEDEKGTALLVGYRRREGRAYPAAAPTGVSVRYFARSGEAWLRKGVVLAMPADGQVDRLEVERFTTEAAAQGGGRGEPVFLGDRWFVGIEYPAAYSRHTDGNTPRAESRRFEAVGNYSHIDLEGRDLEPRAVPGLVRLMHFPGGARRDDAGAWTIVSKTAVAGVGGGEPMEIAFGEYLAKIRRPPRAFLNYNNWFDPEAKALEKGRLREVLTAFRQVLDPAGIHLDALVPDDGWQQKGTLYAPSPTRFPRGLDDVAALGRALREGGSTLGLWLSLSAYNQALPETFPRAEPNTYFAGFKPYWPLALPPYREALGAQLRRLIHAGEVSYLKHDFNPLCDLAAGRGHPATDRHGHEAEMDAMLELLALERRENADLYLNITNWVWFSPWWLMEADALWMLAGDDGFDTNWPELSGRAMATTDRDVYLWRMWGDPKDRPLVPISALMTHGIIRNSAGRMQRPGDTLADWSDHVVMHYGRGVQLKEWYVTPSAMSAEEWKALVRMHLYSERRAGAFVHSIFVGGRPDEGQAYGYVGWEGERGVLVARNPNVRAQTLRVPATAETLYRGTSLGPFRSRVLYPYRGEGPLVGRGAALEVPLPGYATMVLEIEPGESQGRVTTTASAGPAVPSPPEVRRHEQGAVTLDVPDQGMPRCELIVIGYPKAPGVRLAGVPAVAQRSGTGEPNTFARYAKAGMASGTARAWSIASYDLKAHRGRRVEVTFEGSESAPFEAWWLLDRPVAAPVAEETPADEPWAISDGFRRQTIELRGLSPLHDQARHREQTGRQRTQLVEVLQLSPRPVPVGE
jgi:hypothetical protein